MPFFALPLTFSLSKTAAVVVAVVILASFDLSERIKHRESHVIFASVLGTVLSLSILAIVRAILQPGVQENAHIMALGVLTIVILWRCLFGPWAAQTKAVVLGTFLFWIGLYTFFHEPPEYRLVRILATITAVIPAVIWCVLFLEYHRERLAIVILMFFAGMIATIPILFYDALVRRGVELQFFVVKLKPESFNQSTEQFVSGQLIGMTPLHSTVLTVFLSFIIVGLIEEVSKYWVLRRNGIPFITSVDDMLQLSIMVAIGFSFAENVTNPGYFMGFVREYLVFPDTPDIIGFISNVVGRSVMTTMVHIVSTGVMGYFMGLTLFADPLLQEGYRDGRPYKIVEWLHSVLRIKRVPIFRTEMLLIGLVSAIVLHGLFNFLVTLPDIIPGNPRTLGDLLGVPDHPVLQYIAILLFPALFYVVGGFWMLTGLFMNKENMKERGHLVQKEVFIKEAMA